MKKNSRISALLGIILCTALYAEEEIITCENSREATRMARDIIGDRLEHANMLTKCKMAKSTFYENYIGIESNESGYAFKLRLDYDPTKGFHHNVEIGMGRDRRKYALVYKDSEQSYFDRVSHIHNTAYNILIMDDEMEAITRLIWHFKRS